MKAKEDAEAELGALADAARTAAERGAAAIDDALAFIEASNQRIASLEGAAAAADSRRREKPSVKPRRKARR